MVNDKCTVIINSCDDYEDAWYPFFELIKKYWKDCKYPFVLNTETKRYTHEGIDFKEIFANPEKTEYWGSRLIDVLKKIDSKYVILLLEDFFLLDIVDQGEIERCINYMDGEKDIAAIYFKKIMGFENKVSKDYILMKENKRYKLNLQAGLWNREKLIELLDEKDSPWEFEEEGFKRLNNKNYKFYCSAIGSHYDTENNVFKYLVARNFGYGIWKGKWLWNNNRLLKSEGIKVKKINMNKMSKVEYYIWKVNQKINNIVK